jgi:hypothetical protein
MTLLSSCAEEMSRDLVPLLPVSRRKRTAHALLRLVVSASRLIVVTLALAAVGIMDACGGASQSEETTASLSATITRVSGTSTVVETVVVRPSTGATSTESPVELRRAAYDSGHAYCAQLPMGELQRAMRNRRLREDLARMILVSLAAQTPPGLTRPAVQGCIDALARRAPFAADALAPELNA